MAEDTGKLESDILFLALTRPTMILGVTYMWFMIQGMLWAMVLVNTNNLMSLFGGVITHGIGYLICSKEARFVELWLVWFATCTKCRNQGYHGNTHSYDPY